MNGMGEEFHTAGFQKHSPVEGEACTDQVHQVGVTSSQLLLVVYVFQLPNVCNILLLVFSNGNQKVVSQLVTQHNQNICYFRLKTKCRDFLKY